MAATGKGATLTEGSEIVIGQHRVIVVSIDCPARKTRVRVLSTEHVVILPPPKKDEQPCNAPE